ncbi:hypothetical protein BKA70DRAFT_528301 [Coprinopsis sp. MPI-PUGE-AT-0042]|nr:hypothetical protein BKA70DRAFT_528301 [Coprinopsis sp. MPI-PUGE-AT-0042]
MPPPAHNHRSILSLAQQLPPELISPILQHAVLFNQSGRPGCGVGQRITFMRLRCVCSQWRAIALSTPELWSCLEVSLTDMYDRFLDMEDIGPSVTALITGWFSRAKNLPLHLTLSEERGDLSILDVGPLFESSSLNIASLTLQDELIQYEDHLEFVLRPSITKKGIKHLSISLAAQLSNIDATSFASLEATFPLLRTLTLVFTHVDNLPHGRAPFSISHRGITSFNLHKRRIERGDLGLVFRDLPQLEELTMLECLPQDGTFATKPGTRSNAPVLVPALRRLLLAGPGAAQVVSEGIHDTNLVFPNLELLRVSGPTWWDACFRLRDFFVGNHDRQSSVANRRRLVLDLSGTSIDPEALEQVLQGAPTLDKLYLDDPRTVGLELLEMDNLPAREIVVMSHLKTSKKYFDAYTNRLGEKLVAASMAEMMSSDIAKQLGVYVESSSVHAKKKVGKKVIGPGIRKILLVEGTLDPWGASWRETVKANGWDVCYVPKRAVEVLHNVDVASRFGDEGYQMCGGSGSYSGEGDYIIH